jgi:hypothetical protein
LCVHKRLQQANVDFAAAWGDAIKDQNWYGEKTMMPVTQAMVTTYLNRHFTTYNAVSIAPPEKERQKEYAVAQKGVFVLAEAKQRLAAEAKAAVRAN